MTDKSLYDQLGGKDAVSAAVDIFYQKVLADEHINHFFKNIDMESQTRKQKIFLTYAFGGIPSYSGQNMRDAHKHLTLDDSHFDAVAGHLNATLEELNVPEDLISKVMDIAASTRDDVLN